MKYHTLAIHGGRAADPDASIRPVNYPIYLASTFAQNSVDGFGEFVYSRSKNPTRDNVEQLAAQLEGAKHGLAMSSGMSAIDLAMSLVHSGEKVLFGSMLYGGTWSFITHILDERSISYEPVRDFAEYDFDHMDDNVRAIYLETPSNPSLSVTDIRYVAEKAKEHGAIVIVDNTFMTSYLQKPLDLGADVVVYSATKYYGGHSDIIAGLVMVNDEDMYADLKFHQSTLGAPLDPFSSFLLARGIKTLPLRMDRHNYNAQKVAEFFESSGAADRVYYTGLRSDPGHELQKKQARGNGGLLSVDLSRRYDAKEFCKELKLFDLAVSLGGIESLICHPATSTHKNYSEEERAAIGIGDNMLRILVGIEDAEDLIADIEQALEKSKR